jgi:tetratricopeptide (TPR) repeat protein
MLRLLGFFVLVFLTQKLLLEIPVVRDLIGGLGIFGFWVVAIFVGWYLEALGTRLMAKRRFDAQVRGLGNVDTANNQGKLGALLIAKEGQPESSEWDYGLGRAYMGLGQFAQAAEHFQSVAAIDAAYGYGRVLLGLAEARLECDQTDIALQALDRHDSDRGATPESALLRGLVFKKLGLKAEARAAFESVSGLAKNLPASYRKSAFPFQVRAFFARIG